MKKNILMSLFVLTSLFLKSQVPADSLVSCFPFTTNTHYLSSIGNTGVVTGVVLTTDRFDVDNSGNLIEVRKIILE